MDCKKHQYNLVRNYQYCIALIDAFKNDLDYISLDYHLGSEVEHTGYDVLVYMHENKIYPNHINIHSDHETGVRKMENYAKKNFKNLKIRMTRNPASKKA